ncbi:MAG: glycosyltransferase family 4 protein [Pseudanabaenaceae cyanobacterium]|jgi:glycosyltransferase involved in cell wall biosynthesis
MLKKPSISIVTQFYPPDYAATGQFIHDLASALVNEGHSVDVYTEMPGYAFREHNAPRHEEMQGVRVRRSGSAAAIPKRIRSKLVSSLTFWLRCLVKLRHTSLRGKHLLLTSAPPFLGLIGWIYNFLLGHQYSCIVYDVYPDVAVRLGVVKPNHWIVKLWHFANELVWHRATSLIVLSEPMRDLLINSHPKIADEIKSKIHVIPSWSNPDEIQPIAKSENWFAQKHDLVNPFVVLYSGNLGRCHDADTLIQCAELLQNQPHIKFVFIGNGVGSTRIRHLKEAGKLPNVLQLPYQEREVLPFSLTACDLSLVSVRENVDDVVAPSKVYGMLAAGRPIAAICPPGNYLEQMLLDGQCGKSFENGDAVGLAEFILNLAQHHDITNQFGCNARHYLEENFTIEQVLPLYVAALHLKPQPTKLTDITSRFADRAAQIGKPKMS